MNIVSGSALSGVCLMNTPVSIPWTRNSLWSWNCFLGTVRSVFLIELRHTVLNSPYSITGNAVLVVMAQDGGVGDDAVGFLSMECLPVMQSDAAVCTLS